MMKSSQLRKNILSQAPTVEQEEAIFSNEPEFLLRAVPGSGKTWTSCRRFIWRGSNWQYTSGGLALLSFTNTAIREFRDATIDLGKQELISDPNYVGTFDAFVERFILCPFGHLIFQKTERPKLFTNPRPGDRKNSKLQVWMKISDHKSFQVPAWEIIPFLQESQTYFKASKNYGRKEIPLQKAQKAVEHFLALGFYTHSQRAYWACRLLLERTHIAKLLARRFPEIIVDEAQDTSIWLLYLLTIIRNHGSKITLVGDPDQCIYEFSMASVDSLRHLKTEWNLTEKPLNQSFRCNKKIAKVVRCFGDNCQLTGVSSSKNSDCEAFIFCEEDKQFEFSLKRFERALVDAEIPIDRSAILCRGHSQIEGIRGKAAYTDLQGMTKDLGQACFYRDYRKDYHRAREIVESVLRQIIDNDKLWKSIDEAPTSNKSMEIKKIIWKFVKHPEGLPPITLGCEDWIDKLRESINQLALDISGSKVNKLGIKIRKSGISKDKQNAPLFYPKVNFSTGIRQSTIHGVKGESIDAVLVIGSVKFWNAVLKSSKEGKSSEDKRLAYVAMSRARHLLVIGLPKSHFDKQNKSWIQMGFKILE